SSAAILASSAAMRARSTPPAGLVQAATHAAPVSSTATRHSSPVVGSSFDGGCGQDGVSPSVIWPPEAELTVRTVSMAAEPTGRADPPGADGVLAEPSGARTTTPRHRPPGDAGDPDRVAESWLSRKPLKS